jgi:hypothetical protein
MDLSSGKCRVLRHSEQVNRTNYCTHVLSADSVADAVICTWYDADVHPMPEIAKSVVLVYKFHK